MENRNIRIPTVCGGTLNKKLPIRVSFKQNCRCRNNYDNTIQTNRKTAIIVGFSCKILVRIGTYRITVLALKTEQIIQ